MARDLSAVVAQAFAHRAAVVRADSAERTLVVVTGENYSQRDVIANKRTLLAIYATENTLTSLLEEKARWSKAIRDMDNDNGGKLSKSSSAGQTKWANTEVANLIGIHNYFRQKLCKTKGSYNEDVGEVKRVFFNMAQGSAVAVSPAGEAALADEAASCSGIAGGPSPCRELMCLNYPSSDEATCAKYKIPYFSRTPR